MRWQREWSVGIAGTGVRIPGLLVIGPGPSPLQFLFLHQSLEPKGRNADFPSSLGTEVIKRKMPGT